MKKLIQNSTWYVNGIMTGILVAIAGAWAFYAFIGWASAATYNVFFNNVEQGANSTSSPTLQISSNGKPVEKTADPAANAATVETPAPASVAPAVSATPVQTPNIENPSIRTSTPDAAYSTAAIGRPSSDSSDFGPHPLRLSFLADSYLWSGDNSNLYGGMGRISYFPLRDFGISAFGTVGTDKLSFYGGELEFNPIHVGIFGLENLLDAGFVGSVSSLKMGDRSTTVLGGVQAELNLGKRFSLTAGLRTNLSGRGVEQLILGDAGLSVRF